jgi:hypothetical protein
MLLGKPLAAGLAVLCMSAVLGAQGNSGAADPPESAPLHLGPVVLAPSLTLTNFGWDSNVFQQPESESSGDFTATASPRVQGWLRLGPARAYGRGTLAFVYFQNHPSERSVDVDYEGRLDLRLARVTPYVSATWLSAKQRFGFEIDERVRRHQETGVAGVDFRLGPRTDIEVAARRSRLEFNHTDDFQDPVTPEFFDNTSQGASLALRHELTPYTSVSVAVDRHQDRVDLDPGRDTDSVGIASGLEFKPFALISGKAYFGWVRVNLVEPGSAPFTGVVGSIDLAYTLLGATRLAVQGVRDVSYSAVRDEPAYLLAGVTASVTHRLGEGWEVGGRIGRNQLSYGLFEPSGTPDAPPEAPAPDADREIVTDTGLEIGYRVGPSMRIAFALRRQDRRSIVNAERDYERIVAGMSIYYGF